MAAPIPPAQRSRTPGLQLERAKLRVQAHRLREQGVPKWAILQQLDVSRSALDDWLSRPCPTEEQLAELEKQAANPRTVKSGCVPMRSHLEPATFQRLQEEAKRQGAARTRIVDVAIQLYCDAMARARGELEGPIDVRGYRL